MILKVNDMMFGEHYIAEKWDARDCMGGFRVYNPANRKQIGLAPCAGEYEINEAVGAAEEAFTKWSKWSWVKRAEVIDDLVQLVKAHFEEIAVLITQESGKHINEARADVTEGIHMLQYCVGRGRQAIGEKIPSEFSEKESEIFLQSKGVFVVITPWNFPFAIPTWLIGPSLVSGNTVIFKPSEETPFSGEYLIRLFDKAAKKHNAPPGILNLIHGNGEIGKHLVCHPRVVGLLFTGSYAVGKKIKKIAAESDEKFAICEMGGKNSLIVLKDANLNLALNAAILSAYKTTHQRCVSADLIIVEEKIEKEFTKKFLDLTDRMVFGDPFDSKVFAGPLINETAVINHHFYRKKVIEEGIELLRGDLRDDNFTNFVKPNVFRLHYRDGFDFDSHVFKEEAFTPNIAIIIVRDFEEALKTANSTPYGLSMSLITEDWRKMREFKTLAKAGLKYINLPTIGAEVQLPFGGIRRSGTGMPSAAGLFDYMCYKTAFTVNYGKEINLAQGLSSEVKK
ncbi:MAG: aldehyde dehydrogenase family protein [Parcubacteria group bacterium]|nr:aldehyde dehydrogenase family protein [Parcubacteria group bacterium]